MNLDAELDYTKFVLPPSIVAKRDVARLVEEAERVDSEMISASVRQRETGEVPTIPTMSEQLMEFLAQNNLALDDGNFRSNIIKQLRRLKDHVPIIHMTFAVVADPESLQQLSAWLRQSVHPQAVISVGLQPSLIAGVYLRTTNRVKDLSLRTALRDKKNVLVDELEALRVRR